MDNEFNRGIDYAFDYLEKHIIGRVVNGRFEGVITKDQLEELRQSIHRRCDICVGRNPCENDWCCTKDKK